MLSSHWVGCIFFFLRSIAQYRTACKPPMMFRAGVRILAGIIALNIFDMNGDLHSRIQKFSDLTWIKDFEDLLPAYKLETSELGMDYLVVLYKGFNQVC